MDLLIIAGVDVTHFRLIELSQLADQAEAFYGWVEAQFQATTGRGDTLDGLLRTCSQDEIAAAIAVCYRAKGTANLPFLFDGIGRTYPHSKACYYFFSWLIRDAPQQRLSPLIQRIVKNTGRSRTDIEIDVLASLIYQYRANVKTFSWDAVREVIIDRLEGSRRSIKGHEKEAVVRTVILSAIQQYFGHHQHYGMYASIELPATQVMIANESYDVSINLLSTQGQRLSRVLVPIKTRETEGGGHSHLFSRDTLSAIGTVRNENPADYVMVVIAAKNWSPREADNLREIVDHLAIFNLDPGEFVAFNDAEQERLNEFVASVLNGAVLPKSHQTPSESDE